MDLGTQIESIKNDTYVNWVRASVASSVSLLGMGKSDITSYILGIRTNVHGPDIRKDILRSFVALLNYRRIDTAQCRSDLYSIATNEYGRDLRDPIISIIDILAKVVPDDEIDIGTFGYEIGNCIFDATSGVVTPEDPGYGFGGTDYIPNIVDNSIELTVAVSSKIGQTLHWCMLLYDANYDYLYDKTVGQDFNQWKEPGERVHGDFEGVRYIRFFIRSYESGMDLDTIEAPYGYPDDEISAGIQIFNREVLTDD